MNQNTENLLAGQQQNSKESEDQRDLKSVHTPSRMNESGMVIYDEEDIPKTTYTNFTIDSEPAFSSPINSFRHSPSTGQTSSNNRPSSGRKSIADLCALPQWKIDLMEKNKEDIEWRKNLKNKYKTTIFEKRTSGYFMKREDIQEEKKDIYSSYRTTTPRPYIPKGEYIAPEKPIVHPDREQMVFKKRFNYHTQNVKPIFDSNAKRFSQIKKEKEEEMKRHKAEEQQKLEEKKEKIKREKEERRQRLTKLLTKKPPVSGEEIHKQRVEQAKMDRQQKTQKPVVLYPVIESHKLKVRLSEGNSSINGSPNKSPTLRNSLSSPQLIAQTEKEVKVESKSEESLKEYERTPVDSKFQDENKTTQSEENMGEIDQPNSENKHSDKVKEVFTDELHGDLSFELSDEEELVSSSPSPNKVQGHLEGEEEIFELSSDEEENLPSKTKEDDNSIVGSKMIIPLIQFEEDILDNLEKSSYTDTDLLTPEEHQTIYMSLDNLCRIKQSMLRDLKSSVESKSFTTLWDSSNVSMFKDIMTSYVDGIPMSLEIFSEKAAKNSSKSEELMGMISFLLQPSEDVLKEIELIKSIKAYLNNESIQQMEETLIDIKAHFDNVKSRSLELFKMYELATNYSIPEIVGKKKIVKEGDVVVNSSELHHLYLFDDALLVVRPDDQVFIPFKIVDEILGDCNLNVTKFEEENSLELDEHDMEFFVCYKFDDFSEAKQWSKAFKSCFKQLQ